MTKSFFVARSARYSLHGSNQDHSVRGQTLQPDRDRQRTPGYPAQPARLDDQNQIQERQKKSATRLNLIPQALDSTLRIPSARRSMLTKPLCIERRTLLRIKHPHWRHTRVFPSCGAFFDRLREHQSEDPAEFNRSSSSASRTKSARSCRPSFVIKRAR